MTTARMPRSWPIAEFACQSCRRLKMKCIGSDDPPCARCVKAGRECIVQRPARPSHPLGTSSPGFSVGANEPQNDMRPVERTSGSTSGGSNIRDESLGARTTQGFSPINSTVSTTNQSVLPSRPTHGFSPVNATASTINRPLLPSTPLFSTVFNQPNGTPNQAAAESVDSQKGWKRRRTGLVDQSPRSVMSTEFGVNTIPERDIVQYIDIFRKRLLSFIPVIAPEDLDITQLLSTKRPLAHCICYVTARYIPGGESTRAKLVPVVGAILRDKNFLPKSDEEEWTLLQALSVLYAYRTSGSGISTNDSTFEISQSTIKGYIEAYALHLAVHRSVSPLKAAIKAGDPNITSSIAFKKYFYWLWLFKMSHHYSVITGTPPSIREDATIRIAPEILKGIDVSSSVSQVLAEAELCLLWGKAGHDVPGLSEWWCPQGLSNTQSDHIEQGMLDTVDNLLQSWSDKWTTCFPSEPLGPDIGFHFRFTRFCLNTYSVQNLKVVGPNGLSDIQQEVLNRSVAAAASFCRYTLELGPAIRDAARYMADFGFVMISFACSFIIQACENFYTSINEATEHLRDVVAVAQMLLEFAVNSNHGPSIQAKVIIAKIGAIMAARDSNSMQEDETTNEQLGSDVSDLEGVMNDPLWGLLDFFPNTPAM